MAVIFDETKCTRCGECFTRCRYMDLTRGEAVSEIERLIEGRPTRHVMRKCISCHACDAFCPEDAGPYDLILSRWSERYRKEGLPVRASYLLPHHYPNYRTDMESEMDQAERETLARWKSEPAEGEVLYPGCNLLTLPGLYHLKILERLPVSGDWSLCCGEPLFRMGLYDEMEKIAKGLTDYYADKKVERMVFVCPACMNMFKNVLPGRFGARFDFECVHLVDWLLERMDAGELTVKNPLGRRITVHDSCHARVMGPEVMDRARELYRRLGLEIIEMKSHHENGICCGVAAGCRRYQPHDIMLTSRRELKEGEDTGAERMAVYCTGCYIMLNIARHVVRSDQKLVHTLELAGEAVGEPVESKAESRTARILLNIVKKAIPKMLSTRRYRVPKIKIGD